jgi:hypothetical protein
MVIYGDIPNNFDLKKKESVGSHRDTGRMFDFEYVEGKQVRSSGGKLYDRNQQGDRRWSEITTSF